MIKFKAFIKRVFNMIITKNYSINQKYNSKRGRNLLITEMKFIHPQNQKVANNSPKRKHNMLIGAYKVTDWNNNEK